MLYPHRVQVTIWLGVCTFLVFCLVILGGAVRVTGSGLSMVDWRPLMGVFPPVGELAWRDVFAAYQQSPEGILVNTQMTAGEFKFIFYMEYFHRMLGRLVGLAFFLPFCFFLYRGGLPPRLKTRCWLVFLLGAGQGLMGWYMVQSGLVDDPHVSQYRLTAHLLLAVVIFVSLIRLMTGVWVDSDVRDAADSQGAAMRRYSGIVVAFVLLMITSGGFMAGTHAGYIFNTWPQMGDGLIPSMLLALDPWWRNLFENTVTIQFIHRWLAIIVATLVVAFLFKVLALDNRSVVRRCTLVGLVLVTSQVMLGIATLVSGVPAFLAVAHQGTGLLLTGVLAVLWSSYRRSLIDQPQSTTGSVGIAGFVGR